MGSKGRDKNSFFERHKTQQDFLKKMNANTIGKKEASTYLCHGHIEDQDEDKVGIDIPKSSLALVGRFQCRSGLFQGPAAKAAHSARQRWNKVPQYMTNETLLHVLAPKDGVQKRRKKSLHCKAKMGESPATHK